MKFVGPFGPRQDALGVDEMKIVGGVRLQALLHQPERGQRVVNDAGYPWPVIEQFAGQGRRNTRARLPGAYPGKNGLLSKFEKRLILVAHPTRFERVTFAFGGIGGGLSMAVGRNVGRIEEKTNNTIKSRMFCGLPLRHELSWNHFSACP